MMAFITRLPTETFIHILDFLGPEFFAEDEDISRLAVCRQWFDCPVMCYMPICS